MTVDLLAATSWPDGALFGSYPVYPQEPEPASAETDGPATAGAAARAEGFWAAMVRHLLRPADRPALS